MTNFIEIEQPYGTRHLVNVNYIEEVVDCGNGQCVIYLVFNAPDAYEQDSIQLDIPYDEVVSMIKGALNNG